MTRYRIPDTTLTQRIGEELVLLNLNDGTYHGLDPVGTRMFELLHEHGAAEPVVAAMLDEFDTSEAVLNDDLRSLVRALMDCGLLETA